MAALSRIKPGQVLYTVARQPLGNTTLARAAIHPVQVIEVLPNGRGVRASWNGNAPRLYTAQDVASWRVNRPAKRA